MSFGIQVRGLGKVYRLDRAQNKTGRKHALRDVTFTIGEGERVGIVGANGAGKSTLLQILAGVATATSGQVRVQGKVHAALTLGVCLREELTGRENLKLECQIQGMEAAQIPARVEQMIAFAGLGSFIDRPVRTYSSGMLSRLSFANLVFADPEILLVDETLTAGDQFFQRRASEALRSLCARGSVVVLVSHSMDAIVSMCSRCIWLDGGRVVADGRPAEVTAAYIDAQAARAGQEAMRELDRLAHTTASDSRVRLQDCTLASGGDLKAVLDPSDAVTFAADFEVVETLSDVSVTLRVERLDGVLINESVCALGTCAPGRYQPRANLERLSLGPAYYMAHLVLRAAGNLLASRTLPFQVKVRTPFVGGTPMLAPVFQATVERAA